MICIDKITVRFNETDGVERRFIGYVCGPLLVLPAMYNCYVKFMDELLNLLQSEYRSMDIA